jgi:hypothetical protein
LPAEIIDAQVTTVSGLKADTASVSIRLLIVPSTLLTLFLAGCGSSGADSVFQGKAEAVCREMAAAGSLPGGRKPTDLEFSRFVLSWQRGVDRLTRLHPPADQARDFQRMVVAFRDGTKAIDLLAKLDDESVLGAVAAIAVSGDRASRAARGLGLSACILFPDLPEGLRPRG